MSKRSDIVDGRQASGLKYGLIYTDVLGWVDLGHAQGTDIKILMNEINYGESCSQDYYNITYSQSMVDPLKKIKTGQYIKWRIKRGRPYHERQSIALAMMMTVAQKFEAFQQAFPFNLLTDSGFSGEDLVSDLLGFYRAISVSNPYPLLHPVSKEEALRRWDFYGPIGKYKNETFLPILFPDPLMFPNAKPYKSQLPSFMKTVTPYNDFQSGNVAIFCRDGSFIDAAKSGNSGL
ncbi:hypothetical protein [Pantoea cypripedii]|uniref:Uncharacterized protein n=1 Tax=Pantoea cypripedii TaxID=55209 RepID=A0A6B9FZY1_PANCY|nr:hypothetical protein [Pantoea cypripedii]QGY30561.1 hypothetical protein CUN67_17170 [Pantoea cypripedii]